MDGLQVPSRVIQVIIGVGTGLVMKLLMLG